MLAAAKKNVAALQAIKLVELPPSSVEAALAAVMAGREAGGDAPEKRWGWIWPRESIDQGLKHALHIP